jgi:uncharacterized protein (TIGR03083 family)
MVPIEPPVAHAPLLRLERTRLLELLRGLTVDEWGLSTACPGWDVLDLVNHVVGGDVGTIAWHRDGHRGAGPPAGTDEAGFVRWLDELQVQWVVAARRTSPLLAIELLEWLGERVAAALEVADPREVSASVEWAGREPVPVWLDHARELSERWIHRQQLLEAVGRGSDLRPDLAGPVLDALRWAFPYRLADVRREDGVVARVRIVDATLARDWCFVSGATGWEPADEAREPIATVEVSAEQAWRLLTNNLRPSAHGPVACSGDDDVLAALTSTRAIIGMPA